MLARFVASSTRTAKGWMGMTTDSNNTHSPVASTLTDAIDDEASSVHSTDHLDRANSNPSSHASDKGARKRSFEPSALSDSVNMSGCTLLGLSFAN